MLRKPSSSVSVKHKHLLRTKGTFFQYSSARCPTRILTLSALSTQVSVVVLLREYFLLASYVMPSTYKQGCFDEK